jgi:hypothetical protein
MTRLFWGTENRIESTRFSDAMTWPVEMTLLVKSGASLRAGKWGG